MSNTRTNLHPVFDNIFKNHFPVMYETLKPETVVADTTKLAPAEVECYVCGHWYLPGDVDAYLHAKGRC